MKYKGGTIGLGTLSWRGHASLRASYESYKKEQFFDLFDQVVAFLPEPDTHILAVVKDYGVRFELSPENKGILDGMERIARRLQTDYVFFTENDCPLVESHADAQRQITKALALLSQNKACMARMRHTKLYGELFNTIDKYNRYYPQPETMTARLRRALRPAKAKRLIGTSIYAGIDPVQKFPNHISDAGDGFYLVDTDVMPWTNQSIIINRAFFLETIIPYCKSVPFTRGANGFRNLEIELNQSKFWTDSGWKIACGPGLLTHKRAEDRGY